MSRSCRYCLGSGSSLTPTVSPSPALMLLVSLSASLPFPGKQVSPGRIGVSHTILSSFTLLASLWDTCLVLSLSPSSHLPFTCARVSGVLLPSRSEIRVRNKQIPLEVPSGAVSLLWWKWFCYTAQLLSVCPNRSEASTGSGDT